MRFSQLRRRCQERLADVSIPDPFDVDQLAEQVAHRRGRPLSVHALPAGMPQDMPCGFWISTLTDDLVFIEPGTTPFHREQIIVHELAHMICGHVGPPAASHSYAAHALAPHVDPATVHLMLGRTSYTTDQEQEAETVATLILSQARRSPTAPPRARADLAAAVDRAHRTFWQPAP